MMQVTKTNNEEPIDVTFVENKEHERALETPAESEQISEKAGNKVDDIHEERTDVKCVESNDNKEYERAQGSYSDRIKISEKVEKIRNKMKYNSYNKQTECERIPTQITLA